MSDFDDEYDVRESEEVKIEHVGYLSQRCYWSSGDLERAFAFRWIEKHKLFPNTLDDILCPPGYDCDEFQPMTQRDARVAATVIQWLGTNVGFSFMIETLRQAGYKVEDRR
jgi:hypothetical protein